MKIRKNVCMPIYLLTIPIYSIAQQSMNKRDKPNYSPEGTTIGSPHPTGVPKFGVPSIFHVKR